MKVKLRQLYASPVMCAQAGSVIDTSDGEAKALVDGGFAEPVAETATAPAAPANAEAAPVGVEAAAVTAPEAAAPRRGAGARNRTTAI